MKAVLAAPLIVAGLAIAGVAAAAPPANDACFYTRDMGNHKIADDHTLYIHVRQHDIYRLTMRGGCLAGALSSDPIILRSPPGSTHICKPIDLDISIGRAGGGMATPCIVDSIVKLTPGEAAALPKKARP
jgi:hypothetical protein